MDTLASRHTSTIHLFSILIMKKFVIKISLTIVIPVVSFLVAYEVIMRSIPNDYSYKSELWEKKVSEIKVLVFGSSHCYYGFNPAYFDKPAFNSAHLSQSYNYDWFLFDKYYNRMDSLEYVILPLSDFSPFSRLDDGKEAETWRSREYAIFYDCDFHKWYEIRYRYYFTYISIDNMQQAVSRLLDSNFNIIFVDSNGYSLKTSADRVNDLKKDGITAAERHTIKNMNKKTDLYNENYGYVKDIINRCQSRGIRVILVTTPTLPEYYNHLNPKQVQAMENFGHSLEQYDNVQYINLLKSPMFDKNDFFDSDHLCDNGAKKLTLLINDIIKKWDSIPSNHKNQN